MVQGVRRAATRILKLGMSSRECSASSSGRFTSGERALTSSEQEVVWAQDALHVLDSPKYKLPLNVSHPDVFSNSNKVQISIKHKNPFYFLISVKLSLDFKKKGLLCLNKICTLFDILPLPGIETRFIRRPVRSLNTTPTELSRR
jgi:hypothetical protein